MKKSTESVGAFIQVSLAGAAVLVIGLLALQNRSLKVALANRPNLAIDVQTTYEAGETLPSIELIDAAGEQQELHALLGSGAVVAFLTTTCPHCEASLPVWSELSVTLRDQGRRLIAVSLHSADATEAYVERHGIEWPVFRLGTELAPGSLRIRAVPATFVVDEDGSVLRVWRGRLLEAHVDEILGTAD